MQSVLRKVSKTLWSILPYLVLGGILYAGSFYSYIFFHTNVEAFISLIAAGVFILVWNARKIINNNFLVFLAIAYMAVGVLNYFHMLSYWGLPFFSQYGMTLSTQLWIAERLMLAVSLLVAFLFLHKRLNQITALLVFGVITVLITAAIFVWRVFPVTYMAGTGMTAFKKGSEYIISALFAGSVVLMHLHRSKFDKDTFRLLTTSFVFNMIAELWFTLYVGLYDFVTIIGHMAVLLSYSFVYKAIIEIGLTKPYTLLFLEIDQLSKQKDELLHITSHEIKNPLSSIKIYAQMLNTEALRKKGNEATTKMLEQIRLQTEKITRLVNDLSDVGKIETGNLVLNKREVGLGTLVKETVAGFRKINPANKFSVQIMKGVRAEGDKERLGQVVINFLNNAVKYSAKGSRVKVVVDRVGRRAVVAVEDEGRGIPRDKLPYVFDKYFRAEKDGGGMGLGLYISKKIIDQHGGKIWARSREGRGSTFYFSLSAMK